MFSKDDYEFLGKQILDAAFVVHKELGPGMLESIYEVCMIEELRSKNISVHNQVSQPVFFKGKALDKTFFIDLLVEKKIIIELKAVEVLLPIHEVQLLSYMKLADIKLGYLINFNVPLLRDGIKRKINGYL
jgi:GxxExxY protein